MFFRKKKNENEILIQMKRDSVCMGDDCMAPNLEEVSFELSATVMDLLNRAAKYVPAMRNYEWEVKCGTEVLGRLVSGEVAEYQITLEHENTPISELPELEIFCRKK